MPFDVALRRYMTTPLFSVRPEDPLSLVKERLARRRLSSLPVVHEGRLVGLISRSDLLRVSRRLAREGGGAQLLAMPARPVSDSMSRNPVTVGLGDSVATAAARMLAHRIHRVYVVEGDVAVGVLSVRDLLPAVRDAGDETQLLAIMSAPVRTVTADQPLSAVVDQLASGHSGGVVVIEDDRPVGVFSQVEALAASDLPPGTRVDEVMEPMICLPARTPLHRAAARAIAMRVDRVLVVEHGELLGLASAFDFARHIAHPTAPTDPS
jgi:CBS domain-containing protein